MTLKKQSIRSNQKIYLGNSKTELTKDEIIQMSEDWNETQTNFFKKMLKQGGKCKVNGTSFNILVEERSDLDSNRQAPVKVPPLPGERTF